MIFPARHLHLEWFFPCFFSIFFYDVRIIFPARHLHLWRISQPHFIGVPHLQLPKALWPPAPSPAAFARFAGFAGCRMSSSLSPGSSHSLGRRHLRHGHGLLRCTKQVGGVVNSFLRESIYINLRYHEIVY